MIRSRTAAALALAALVAAGAVLAGETKPEPGELNARFPAFSPDGDEIAFSLHGDLWIAPADGGFARRITLSDAFDTKPVWSPDGATLAFSSTRAGNWDVWVIDVEGGAPRQVTFDSAFDSPSEWSADGQWILFHSSRDGGAGIFRIPAGGGFAERLTDLDGRDGALAPDGRTLVYCWGQADLSRKAYAGSSNWDLFVQEGVGAVPRRLTDFPGNDTRPFFVPNRAGEVYYLSERDGVANLFKIPLAGGEPARVTKQGSDMAHPAPSADGAWVIYEMDFRLFKTKLDTGETVAVPITINADMKGPSFEDRTLTAGAEQPGWSPDGQKIAFELRGDIWIMDAAGGNARRLTSGAARDGWPKVSPDGSRIAFYSDRSGNRDLWTMDLKGGNLTQITFDKADDHYHDWHPSGQGLVFCSERSGNKDIWTLDLLTGVRKQLTTTPQADDDPVWSPDGKWIAFDSGRTGQQNVYVMDAEGGQVKRLTSGTFDQVPSWSPDGKFLAFERNENDAGSTLWVVSRDGGPAMQVSAAGSGPRWSPKGDCIAFTEGQGDGAMIHTVDAPSRIVTGKPLGFNARIEVDLHAERFQAFEEAWKALQDSFYDPAMHGVDWKKVRARYEPAVRSARTTEELNGLIDQMLGELKASHMGVWGGATARIRNPQPATGDLGLKLSWDDAGAFRVDDVLPGGPADQVWIRQGDYLFEIEGKALTPKQNLAQLLAGTAGRKVKVRVGPSSARDESRVVEPTPLDWGRIRGIEYRNWLAARKETVKKAGGKLGYIHLRGMGDGDLEHFKREIAGPLARTEGLVLDVRNNGGGHIHQDLLDILTRRPFGAYHPRGGKKTLQPALYYTRPVVVLINERSFSDAEVFPYGFRALKRGVIVGVPTNGGVIGTGSTTLINGATVRLPRVGWFTLEGKNLEGLGVEPDVRVEETLEDRILDRDPQLDKAIEVLMGLIAKEKAGGDKEKADGKEETGDTTSREEGF